MICKIIRYEELIQLGKHEQRRIRERCSKEEASRLYKMYLAASTNLYLIRFIDIFFFDVVVLCIKISKGYLRDDNLSEGGRYLFKKN